MGPVSACFLLLHALLCWAGIRGESGPSAIACFSCDLRAFCVGRLTLRWRRVLPLDHFPHRLPLQAAQGQLHDEDLPPEHQRERLDLSRHFERPVVASAHDLEGCAISGSLVVSYRLTSALRSAALNLLDAHRSEPG